MVHYVSSPTKAPQALPFQDSKELRYLEYFRLRTAPDIAGVHNPELWTYHVMQVAVAEPAIWHATLALGSLHERFESNASMSLSTADMEYPLTQYGKAINILCSSIKGSADNLKETPLLACAMFCAFESMGYHLHSALSHITSGLKVMTERKRAFLEDKRPDHSLHMLWPLFTRLDTQRLELGDSSFPADMPLIMHYRHVQTTKSIIKKPNMNEARHGFDSVLNLILHHIKHIEGPDVSIPFIAKGTSSADVGLSDVVHDYLRWTSAFDPIIVSLGVTSDIPSALLLQIWRLLVNIMLRVDVEEGEMGFDRFQDEFRLMWSLVEEFLCWSAQHSGSGEELLPEQTHSPLDDPLPEELCVRHTALTGEAAQRSGFMGVNIQNTAEADSVRAEASAAQESGQKLLAYSQKTRSINPGVLRDRLTYAGLGIKPTFTFSHGVIYPLYVVISRCRNPAIRRRAWTLMNGCNRREGLWDSALAARLGQRIIQIEESQALLGFGPSASAACSGQTTKITAASQIANFSRIRMVRPTFLPNRRSIERYYFGWPGSFEEATGVEEVWNQESMEW
ncbi:hypothetical protein M409DRAFT_24612 [Zasmidium cellare ATCC 36951]|uniref:C6 zinc finger domain protein n=1 Tax=Zasmidium cellare ATCC 36951 TaxID=1080233 RepID=A0A6A6CHR1_ZASCE|nr:uncharacterized protein M409DRAFT_24612 [Zasmidium cellare ATCC 36951]KAF2165229.1 hypothetical protein M409DRAFT_24612 [Zasmidium cellare ATCC 36951]